MIKDKNKIQGDIDQQRISPGEALPIYRIVMNSLMHQ